MTSLWFETALLPDGWQKAVRLSVSNGRITSVESGADSQGAERHAVGLPGMPNLHSHAFQRVIAGLTEQRSESQDSFWSWREQMYRFQAQIGPDELQTIAALAYMEMLEAGFTRVGEFHYLHHAADGPYADPAEMSGRIAAAAAQIGIGLTLLPVFYAHSGFGGLPPTPGQARFIHDLDAFAKLLDGARRHAAALDDAMVGIAPHSLRAVTADELAALVPLAEGAPIHIHIAEQLREVEDCVAHTGQRPVEWLIDHAPVDAQWCLVHGTHMTPEETSRLAKSGAVAGLCPITEANLGDGIFPARDYLAQGGRFGIGSDSNVLISVAEELRLLEYGQRLIHRQRNVLANPSSGETLFTGALAGGAQALGVEAGLRIGASADIISLEGGQTLDHFVFASARSPIDCVWRFGRKQVSGGRHIRRDAILADYRKLLHRLMA